MKDDREFLLWLYDRLLFVYGENPNMDYMQKFYKIIQDIPVKTNLNKNKE